VILVPETILIFKLFSFFFKVSLFPRETVFSEFQVKVGLKILMFAE